ncbi:MAG TPA: HEAT repeat domain-containing protein [Bryobacteraceae bacterium]|nr:HEAT repeat domain-containing protein [Bryobacteraceae bacterium]HPT27506.1 HEAT repeat domain-containing protein [Bryobacteraceae bacterium]
MRLCAILLLPLCLVLAQDQPGSKEKIKAARAAAKGGAEGIPQLDPLLMDQDVEVRREAIKSLAAIGTQHGLDLLVRSTRDGDAEIQIRAVDALVNFYLPGYVTTGLSATLKRAGKSLTVAFREEENRDVVDPDTPVRPEIRAAVREVITKGQDNVVRANAARALGILRDRDGVQTLIEALRSKDDRLIFESLIGLQKIGDPEAGPRVVFLMRDLVEKVQLAAIETAGLLKAKDAVGELRRLLETGPEKKARRAAVLALARIADPGSHDFLAAMLRDKDEEVRAAAAEGVGRIANRGDLDTLKTLFDEENKTVARLAQCFGIARLGGVDLSEMAPLRYLVNNLNSRSWQGIAQPYLNELAKVEAVRKAIYPALGEGTTTERSGLMMALAGSGAADALSEVERYVKDPDIEVANSATRALRILRASVR